MDASSAAQPGNLCKGPDGVKEMFLSYVLIGESTDKMDAS